MRVHLYTGKASKGPMIVGHQTRLGGIARETGFRFSEHSLDSQKLEYAPLHW